KAGIEAHCDKFERMERVLKKLPIPEQGLFVAPTVIKLEGIQELEQEIFGPVLHVATFEADEIDQVVDTINAQGYGLTFGLHTRVDSRVERIINRVKVGNIYVNRNQIGAIVGSQPFGGEGLSGTGPKAGGPQYVRRFMKSETPHNAAVSAAPTVTLERLQMAIDQLQDYGWADPVDRAARLKPVFGTVAAALDAAPEAMPGPTGEINSLSCCPRGVVLCLGPDKTSALAQAGIALSQGNAVVAVAPGIEAAVAAAVGEGIPVVGIDGLVIADALAAAKGIEAVASAAGEPSLRAYRLALSKREGALLPLITEQHAAERFVTERHLCVDTTAAGGNASLIAASE
ncbi:MAG: aldehyde dehydrogenase family protein, partial [Halopseudomonas sp.]